MTNVTHEAKPICARCVLPENKPGIWFDQRGVCNLCNQFDAAKDHKASRVEFLESDLIKQVERLKKKKKGKYDCMVMCSGGKDSTSALLYAVRRYRLKPLAFTFDHCFENPEALENIRRAVDKLGVDWMYYRSVEMKEMFAKIIRSGSRAVICHVCAMWYMKTTYDIANKLKIPMILAGWTKAQASVQSGDSDARYADDATEYLSMGAATQQFLGHHLPEMPQYKDFPQSMAAINKAARKKYKVAMISPHWFLPQDVDQYVEEIERELGWQQTKVSYPAQSTNCLLNFISVEKSMKDHGFTHYHVEMSKQIRMGSMTREEALELLKIDFDDALMQQVLEKIGCTLEDLRGS